MDSSITDTDITSRLKGLSNKVSTSKPGNRLLVLDQMLDLFPLSSDQSWVFGMVSNRQSSAKTKTDRQSSSPRFGDASAAAFIFIFIFIVG